MLPLYDSGDAPKHAGTPSGKFMGDKKTANTPAKISDMWDALITTATVSATPGTSSSSASSSSVSAIYDLYGISSSVPKEVQSLVDRLIAEEPVKKQRCKAASKPAPALKQTVPNPDPAVQSMPDLQGTADTSIPMRTFKVTCATNQTYVCSAAPGCKWKLPQT